MTPEVEAELRREDILGSVMFYGFVALIVALSALWSSVKYGWFAPGFWWETGIVLVGAAAGVYRDVRGWG